VKKRSGAEWKTTWEAGSDTGQVVGFLKRLILILVSTQNSFVAVVAVIAV
jgi:hypothetical protein